MSVQPTVITESIRIAQSRLTDTELCFIVDIIDHLRGAGVSHPPGWSGAKVRALCADFAEAAKVRGIQEGLRVVTTTVDLRS